MRRLSALPFRFLLCCALGLAAATAARADGCPPFSGPALGHENDEVVPCNCLPGFSYGKHDRRCHPIPWKREPVMRAMTPAECVRMEDDIKTARTKRCSADFYDCLVARGMSSDAAWCAASLVLLGAKRTQQRAIGALFTCGPRVEAGWRACAATADGCRRDAERTYDAKRHACPGG